MQKPTQAIFPALALMLMFSGSAMAHTITGTITAANAVDVYNFQCFTDTPPLLPSTLSGLPAHHVHLNLDSGAVRVQLGHIATTVSGYSPATPGQNWTGFVSDSTPASFLVHANGSDLIPPQAILRAPITTKATTS